MWRVIIRWSFDNDTTSSMRNALESLLGQAGIKRTTTGTWECQTANPVDAAQKISDLLARVANPALVNGVNSGFLLDHLWIYIDRGQGDN